MLFPFDQNIISLVYLSVTSSCSKVIMVMIWLCQRLVTTLIPRMLSHTLKLTAGGSQITPKAPILDLAGYAINGIDGNMPRSCSSIFHRNGTFPKLHLTHCQWNSLQPNTQATWDLLSSKEGNSLPHFLLTDGEPTTGEPTTPNLVDKFIPSISDFFAGDLHVLELLGK